MGREDHDRELTDLVQRLREDEVIVCEPEDFINGRIEVHKPTTKELEAADAIEAQAKRIEELEKNYEEAREELTASYLCGYERAKSELCNRIEELEIENAELRKGQQALGMDLRTILADIYAARKVLGEKE